MYPEVSFEMRQRCHGRCGEAATVGATGGLIYERCCTSYLHVMRRWQVVSLLLGLHLGLVTGMVAFLSRLLGTGLPPVESLLVAIWTLPLAVFVAWFIGRDLLQLIRRRPLLRPALAQLLLLALLLLVWAVVPV